MKKIKLFLIALLISVSTFSQEAMSRGSICIDGFYGFPNVLTAVFKNAYANSSTVTELKIAGIGPLGGRLELMASDRVGLGIEVNYANSSVEYKDVSSSSSIPNNVVYNYKVSFPRTRIMGCFALHFGKTEHFDAYWAIRAGVRTGNVKLESNDPTFKEETIVGLVPFAFRTAVGARYFFTDNIGLNFEIGFFGPPVSLGLSVKF